MKNKVLAAITAAALAFTLTGCSAINDTLTEQAKFYAGQNLFGIITDEYLVDVTWEEAAEQSEILREYPKLFDIIPLYDTTKAYRGEYMIRLRDADHSRFCDKYVDIMTAAGFECKYNDYFEYDEYWHQGFEKVKENSEHLNMEVKIEKQIYPQTYNVTFTFKKWGTPKDPSSSSSSDE